MSSGQLVRELGGQVVPAPFLLASVAGSSGVLVLLVGLPLPAGASAAIWQVWGGGG